MKFTLKFNDLIKEFIVLDELVDVHSTNYIETPISVYAAKEFSDCYSEKLGRYPCDIYFEISYQHKDQNHIDSWSFSKNPLNWPRPLNKGASDPSPDNTDRLCCYKKRRAKK